MGKITFKKRKFSYEDVVDEETLDTLRALEDERMEDIEKELVQDLVAKAQLAHVLDIFEDANMFNSAPALNAGNELVDLLDFVKDGKQTIFENPESTCWIGSRITIEETELDTSSYAIPIVCLPTKVSHLLDLNKKLSKKDLGGVQLVAFAAQDFADEDIDVVKELKDIFVVPSYEDLLEDFGDWLEYKL